MKNLLKPIIVFLIAITTFGLSACKKDCLEKGNSNDCPCLAVYDPVCGCNGKTYENECRAECAKIKNYTKGACK